MRRVVMIAMAVIALAMQGDASARERATRPKAQAVHGGDAIVSGAYQLELVVNDNALLVYVSDRTGADVDAREFEGAAVVVSGKDTVNVRLHPEGGNLLSGRGGFILDPKMRVTVKVKPAGHAQVQATFRPLRKFTQ